MVNCKRPPGRPKKHRPHHNLKKRNVVDESQTSPVENKRTHLIVSPEKQEKIASFQTTAPPVSNIQKENIVAMVDDSPSSMMKEDTTALLKRTLPHRKCKEASSTPKCRKVLEGHSSKQQSSGNRLVDLDSLVDMIEGNTVCRICGSDVKMRERTVGISTSIVLECTDEMCNVKTKTDNQRTHFSGNKMNYNTMESYATNVFLVLALQQIGAGASDCGLLLTFLNLPSAASFQSKSFSRIENCVRPTIKKLTQQSIDDALAEEIKETIKAEKPPRARKALLESFEKKEGFNKNDAPLTVCYDMGWNKRSSGTRYDSISGHGLMIGGYSKKVIGFKCVSKECSVCSKYSKEPDNLPKHECTKNHEGSSKSMECEAILDLIKEAYFERNFCIGTVVADDDTTMKKTLRHNYKKQVEDGLLDKKDWPLNKKGKLVASGKLPDAIPPPKFLADFNHRVKSVGRAVYELATMSKSKSMVDKDLAKRLKKYWSKMLQQVKKLDLQEEWEEIDRRVRAPIEHLFNNHQFCQMEWCYALQAQKEGKIYTPDKRKPFYCKVKDKKMLDQLEESVRKFQTKENVKECLHSFDTQKNEAVNNLIARVAPKFKHFGTTPALDTRVSTVAGTTNMGYKEYYINLLHMLVNSESITGSVIEAGIKRTDRIKQNNRKRKSTNKNKRDRTHGKESRSKRAVFEERIDDEKNMGTYKGSIAMNDSDDEEKTTNDNIHTQQFSNSNNENRIQTKKIEASKSKKKFCKWCNTETDHKTWRSANCVAHPQYLQTKLKNKQDKERKEHLPKEKEEEGTKMLISRDDGGGGSAVAVDVNDDNLVGEKISIIDASLLLCMRQNNE